MREQLGRLGGTPFRLGRLENGLEGEVILPMSELNRLRRELVSRIGSNCAPSRSAGRLLESPAVDRARAAERRPTASRA